jgi:hypothetical protein
MRLASDHHIVGGVLKLLTKAFARLAFASLVATTLFGLETWCSGELAAQVRRNEDVPVRTDRPQSRDRNDLNVEVRDHRILEVEVTEATPTQLRGVARRGRIGLKFESRKEGGEFQYFVTTLDDQVIAMGRNDGVSVIGAFGPAASIAIGKADLERFRQETEAPKGDDVEVKARELAGVSDQLEAIAQVQGDIASAQATIATPEYALLPLLSDQLARAGMIGSIYQPSFAIHALGMAAVSMLEASTTEAPQVLEVQRLPSDMRRSVTGRIGDLLAPENAFGFCWDTDQGANVEDLPQCPLGPLQCAGPDRGGDAIGDDCFGACGPGCTCWSSLCGDCCFNNKCAIHDTITGNCSWNPVDWGSCLTAANPVWLVGWGCS